MSLSLPAAKRDRLLPRDFLPGLVDRVADHRLRDAVLVRRVAEGEAALHAGVAVVRLAVLVRHHAHDLLALHLGAERAADAAIGAGRDDVVLRLAHLDERVLGQRRRRASLHAGAAGNALGVEERLILARRDLGIEAAAVDRQRERALHFLAGPHAARADDALARIEREVRDCSCPSRRARWFSPAKP